jgi:spermidine synthase
VAILYEIKTPFHNIRITEENFIRKMLFGYGPCSEQSAINLQKPSEHVFDFTFLAMHSLLITPYPSKILIIGLGGGVLPTEMEKYASGVTIDVIEIDPEVLRLAKEYFYFKESEKVKVYLGDAFDLVPTLKDQYDIIIVDAFLTNYIPFHIMSKEFFESVFKITSDNGVVAVNISNKHPSFYSHVNTIRNVFGDILYQANGIKNEVSSMIFAVKKDREIVKLHGHPICHFLAIQPEKIVITNEIKNAKILSLKNV